MRLFPAELEIAPDEGFTPTKDIFGRKEFGDRLSTLVSALEDPNVLLLDAPWGTGKTTFVKMWRGELLKQGIQSIYFDAFANDYQGDTFLAIASHIVAVIDSQRTKAETSIKTFKERTLTTAKILARASLRIGVRAATAGLVEGDELENAAAEIAKKVGHEASQGIDDFLKSRLEGHEADRRAFENFRNTLAELTRALLPTSGFEQNVKRRRPLVFIIDELDRCRPSFALELLEKIKHFFSVEGVVFVLVSSLSQLEMAVRLSYGEIDAKKYLEKFYHLRVLFPADSPGRPDLSARTYLHHLGCHHEISEIVGQFARAHPLSLRTLERVAAYAKLVKACLPDGFPFLSPIVSVLCVIRVEWPTIYERLRSWKVSEPEIAQLLELASWRTEHDQTKRSQLSERVQEWWVLALNGPVRDEEQGGRLDQLRRQLMADGIDAMRLVPEFCNILDSFAVRDN